jgi:hypothetical protein
MTRTINRIYGKSESEQLLTWIPHFIGKLSLLGQQLGMKFFFRKNCITGYWSWPKLQITPCFTKSL